MTERSVTHATFAVERTYDASPARVFAAWADPEAKAAWTWCHENQAADEFDFRVGGRELTRGGPPGGPMYTVDIRYQDIVPDRRIVYTYAMLSDETLISVSVMTAELEPVGAGTRLVLTEQGAFLDGYADLEQREHGMGSALEKLAAVLQGEPAAV